MRRVIFILSLLINIAFGQTGFAGINNSLSSAAAANPTLLTWTKVAEKYYQPSGDEYFYLLDPNFVHYTSNFSVSVSNLSAISGSTPTVSGGSLNVTGTTSLTSTTNPVAAFACVEMIGTMGTAATTNQLGVQLVKSSTEYIRAFYDKATSEFKIVIDGTTKVTKTATVNTTNIKMWLVLQGNTICFWVKESGQMFKPVAYINASDNPTFEYEGFGIITDYKYGIWCNSTATHTVSSLRGGASGGAGVFNDRVVKNQDGSDYDYSGKWLITADWTALGTRPQNYVYASATVFSIDKTTYEIESVGRIYLRRNEGTGDRVRQAQDIKLLHLNDGNFLITHVPLLESDGSLIGPDRWAVITSSQVFNETILDDADFNAFSTFETITYDVNVRKYSGLYTLYGADGFGSPRPVKYTGTSLTTLGSAIHYDDGTAFESVTVFFLNHIKYPLYSTFGSARVRCFNENLVSVGWMNLPNNSSTRIAGYDQALYQHDGITEYHLIGFDVVEVAPTDITGASILLPWTMGLLNIYKANETSTGYEF